MGVATKGPSMKRTRTIARGCLVIFLLFVFFMIFVGWQAREPGRRASTVHDALQEGMHMREVVNLLTGRTMTTYAIHHGDEIDTSPRDLDEFVSTLEALDAALNAYGVASITFLGSTPARVTVSVEVASDGTVTKISDPIGWD